MACNQSLSGLARDCSPNMGGIKRVLFANSEDVTAVAVTTNKITTITMASTAKFKEYSLPKYTGNFTTALQKDEAAGNLFYQSTLNFSFNRMETTKRMEIAVLAQNDLVAIVEDMNGVYHYFGKDEPLSAIAGDVAMSGTARTDRNGYGIALQDNSKELPYEVDADIIAALIG